MNKSALEDYKNLWNDFGEILPTFTRNGYVDHVKEWLRTLKSAHERIFNDTEGTVQEEYEKAQEENMPKYTDADGFDIINSPTHYNSCVDGVNIEAIDCMRAAFGDEDVKSFCICNAMKYLFRCYHKGRNADVAKAQWYLNKFMELGGMDDEI